MTDLLFDAYVGIHQVRRLVFDKIPKDRCPAVYFNELFLNLGLIFELKTSLVLFPKAWDALNPS